MALPTDRKLVEEIRADLFRQTVELDYQSMFPRLRLGPHRDPRKLAERIRADVGKLKSCSVAGRRAIIEERCARVGVSPDGEPTFHIGRTEGCVTGGGYQMTEKDIEHVAIAIADYLRGRPLETTDRVLATGGAIEMAKIAIAALPSKGIAGLRD